MVALLRNDISLKCKLKGGHSQRYQTETFIALFCPLQMINVKHVTPITCKSEEGQIWTIHQGFQFSIASCGSFEALAFASSSPSSSSASIQPFLEEMRHIGELLRPPLPRTNGSVACSQQLNGHRAHSCRRHPCWRWWGRLSACGRQGWWTRGCSCSSKTPTALTSSLVCPACLEAFSNGSARQQLIQFFPAMKRHVKLELILDLDVQITFHCLKSSCERTMSAQDPKTS